MNANSKTALFVSLLALLAVGSSLFLIFKRGSAPAPGGDKPKTTEAASVKSPAATTTDFGNPYMEQAITDYLLTQPTMSWKTSTDGRNFCVVKNLGKKESLFPVYVWARCGEFAVRGGKLQELSGSSVPLAIDYPNELSFYDLKRMSHRAPRDGSFYVKDLNVIFPGDIRQKLSDYPTADMQQKIEDAAKRGFGLQ